MPKSYRFQIVFDKPNITFWVNSVPELTEHDLIAIETVSTTSGLQLKLKFDLHGSYVLEQLTGGNRGKYVAVVINARPVAAILLREVSRNGELSFLTNLSDEQTKAVVAALQESVHAGERGSF